MTGLASEGEEAAGDNNQECQATNKQHRVTGFHICGSGNEDLSNIQTPLVLPCPKVSFASCF
jgi:hypothetical protein